MTEEEQGMLIIDFTCDMAKIQAIGQDEQLLPRIEKLIADAEAFGRKAKAKEMAAGLLAAAKKVDRFSIDNAGESYVECLKDLRQAIDEFEIAVEPEE